MKVASSSIILILKILQYLVSSSVQRDARVQDPPFLSRVRTLLHKFCYRALFYCDATKPLQRATNQAICSWLMHTKRATYCETVNAVLLITIQEHKQRSFLNETCHLYGFMLQIFVCNIFISSSKETTETGQV